MPNLNKIRGRGSFGYRGGIARNSGSSNQSSAKRSINVSNVTHYGLSRNNSNSRLRNGENSSAKSAMPPPNATARGTRNQQLPQPSIPLGGSVGLNSNTARGRGAALRPSIPSMQTSTKQSYSSSASSNGTGRKSFIHTQGRLT